MSLSLLVPLAVLIALGVAFGLFTLLSRGPEDTLFVALLRAVCLLYAKTIHRLKVHGPRPDPVPHTGAFIVVANHRSGVDPIVISVATRRRLRFLMAKEYYEIPVLHGAFRALQCIPVKRDGNDLGATKMALSALREGHVIAIFPQGGIREANTPLEGKEGVALLSVRTGAPVIPVYVDGSPNKDSALGALFVPSRTTVRFGEAMDFSKGGQGKASREDLEAITAAILERISSLGRERSTQPEARPVSEPPGTSAGRG